MIQYLLNLLLGNEEAFVTIIGIIITIGFYLITKKAPSIQQSAIIKGVSVEVERTLALIFKQTELDHVKYNEKSLNEPVPLRSIKDVGEQKMAVAVQAMKEKLPKSTLNKVGDLFSFASRVYYDIRPMFRGKK